jgi:putative transposase
MVGPARPTGLRVGDRVRFDGATWTVTGLACASLRLVTGAGEPSVVLLTHLLAAPDFELLEHPAPSGLPPLGRLEGLPEAVAERARWWERHVVEVISGLPPGVAEGARPRDGYDPARPIRQRDAAKAAELTAAGHPTSAVTVQRLRLRYQAEGLWGLVDRRAARPSAPFGRADPRLVAAIRSQLDAETDQSTGTRGRLRRRVAAAVEAEHGPGTVVMPSKATFNRLVATLSAGRHTFASARTRRALANRPARPFAPTLAARPGEQVQIDATRWTSWRSSTTACPAGWNWSWPSTWPPGRSARRCCAQWPPRPWTPPCCWRACWCPSRSAQAGRTRWPWRTPGCRMRGC